MLMRSILPLAAVALAFGTASGCSTESSAPPQVRPAQMPQASRCDDLLRAAEVEMPNAVGLRVASARANIAEARELCHSGQDQEATAILEGVLSDIHEGG